MKKCVKCGYVAADEDRYCSACGAEFGGDNSLREVKESVVAEQTPTADNSVFLKYSEFLNEDALYRAGLCKLDGIGVDKNEEEAFGIFRALAFRGHYDGMYKLAEMYLGQVPPDTQSAREWLKIAADGGHEKSRIKLKILKNDAPLHTENKLEYSDSVSSLGELVRQALPNIVTLRSTFESDGKCKRLVGSGFIVDGGYVVTNAHVIGENPSCITAAFESGIDEKSYSLLPVAVRADYDVAVLKFTGLAAQKAVPYENLKLSSRNAYYGEDVYTIGNPLGIGLSVSKGVVSCPERESGYPKGVSAVIQTDITANHGNSGGALLDNSNNVLGMITYTPGESEGGIAMCVPSKYISEVLNSINRG